MKSEKDEKVQWKKGFTLFKRFWPYLRPENRLAAIIALLILLAIPTGVISPFLVKLLFDDVIPSGKTELLIQYSLIIAGLTLFSTLLQYVQTLLTIKLHNRVLFRIARAIFDHLLRLPLKKIHKTETGYLMSRLRDDVAALDSLMTDTFVEASIDVLKAILFCSLLLYIDCGLALSGLVLIAVILGCVLVVSPALRRRSAVAQEADARSSAGLHEALTGIETVRTAARESHERRRFGVLVKKALRTGARRDVLGAITETAIGLAGVLGGYVIVAVGAYRIMTDASTVGNLFAFFIILTQLLGSAGSVLSLFPSLQKGLASLQRIFELLDEPGEPTTKKNAHAVTRLRGEIRFENVSFAYKEGQPVLDSISLTIQPGEITALVGRSGAGKSTLVHLLPRLYPVTGGELLIDGRNVNDFPLQGLRKQIGVVPQDVFLFDRSIKENIAYAFPHADEAAIQEAARIANADAFIEKLPNGYDTLVGERGVQLSGGEKQRLAIAREILRDPAILIFDEATSNLDSENEQLIREAINRLVEGRTCIVISHRLSSIRDASHIIVLDKGCIMEEGTHRELSQKNGFYCELLQRQMLDEK